MTELKKLEQTIVIPKEQAKLVESYLNGKTKFRKKDAPIAFSTKFGSDIDVFISLERAHSDVLAQFHIDREYIVSMRTKKSILGTYVFNVYGTEYQVHVRTPEAIEEEEQRRQQPPNGYFISEKKIKKIEKLKSKKKKRKNYYILIGWDEYDEKLDEFVEYQDAEFADQEDFNSYLNEEITYIWKHYQLRNTVTDEEYKLDITQADGTETTGREELKNWLFSLPLDFNS